MYKIGTSEPWTLGVERLCYEYNPHWTSLIKKKDFARKVSESQERMSVKLG